MKKIIPTNILNFTWLLGAFIAVFVVSGITDVPVESKVYTFSSLAEHASELKGNTVHFESFEMDVITLEPGKHFAFNPEESGFEKLIIIKEGLVEVSLEKESKELGANSIALMMPGEKYQLKNSSEKNAVYYEMKYKSKNKADLERAEEAGGSFLINFEELEYNQHDRGGIRNYYNRPTAMTDYFEMHVTNLNGMIKSHEPHTHGAAEIVLMIKGNTEMQIGDEFYSGTAGDIYFLESNVPHAIQNKSEEQCMYFAFQWE